MKDYNKIGLTWSSNAIEEKHLKVVLEAGLTVRGRPLRDSTERKVGAKMPFSSNKLSYAHGAVKSQEFNTHILTLRWYKRDTLKVHARNEQQAEKRIYCIG